MNKYLLVIIVILALLLVDDSNAQKKKKAPARRRAPARKPPPKNKPAPKKKPGVKPKPKPAATPVGSAARPLVSNSPIYRAPVKVAPNMVKIRDVCELQYLKCSIISRRLSDGRDEANLDKLGDDLCRGYEKTCIDNIKRCYTELRAEKLDDCLELFQSTR